MAHDVPVIFPKKFHIYTGCGFRKKTRLYLDYRTAPFQYETYGRIAYMHGSVYKTPYDGKSINSRDIAESIPIDRNYN